MLLWICFAVLTATVVAVLLRPLRSAGGPVVGPTEADLAVYKDQLRELDRERERGLLGAEEAESARTEVARRLLKHAGTAPAPAPVASGRSANAVYVAVAALLPLVSVGIYVLTGAPQLPGRPFAERTSTPVAEAPIVDLIARVEERLREHPEDGKGWDVISPIYLRLGRYGDAAHGFAEAIRLEGETARRLLGFAEATMLAENGIVSDVVRKACERILMLEPDRIEPRVWLALAREQDGDLKGAAADYKAMLDSGGKDAPWRQAVTERLDLLTKRINGEPAPPQAPVAAEPPASGPSPSDVAGMSPAEREQFVTSMVDRLAARLKDNGKDLEGWMRLARAYKVLGRDTDAVAAITSARQIFAGDAASLAEIAQSEKSLGLAP
jgi:cytochrome c-type biogenesis protein CcmH